MKLAQLQTLMLGAVTRPQESDPKLTALICPTRGIAAKRRLDAYRDNIRGTHLAALEAAYPVTCEILGPRYWRQLLTREIPAFEAAAPDLHDYGDFVPGLLAHLQETHDELAQFDYLGELAQLEWALHCQRFAAAEPQFDWDSFQALDSKQQTHVCLMLRKTLRPLHFTHPVDAVWHAHQEPPVTLEAQGPVVCFVHPVGDFEVTVTRLTDEDQQLWEALRQDARLNKLPEQNSPATAHALHRWIQQGWIVGFQENPDSAS